MQRQTLSGFSSKSRPRPEGAPRLYAVRPAGQGLTELPECTAANNGQTAQLAGDPGTWTCNASVADVNARWGYTPTAAQQQAAQSAATAAAQETAQNNAVTQGVFSSLGSALNMSGPVLAAALNQGGETERARIAAEAQRFRDQLLVQQAQNPANASFIQSQLAAVNSVIARTSAASSNTMLYVGLGVAALAVGYVLYTRSRPRRNPVVVQVGGDGRKRRRFINAKKYRAMQARAR